MSEATLALRRSVACLAVEVPGIVWDDVNAKAEAVMEELAALRTWAASVVLMAELGALDDEVAENIVRTGNGLLALPAAAGSSPGETQ